jgi:hypothetical protein
MPTAQYGTLRKSFIDGGLPEDLVASLLDEYESNKRRYFLNDYRPAAVDAGRFCEAVTRVVQYLGKDPHVPLSAEIKVESALNKIENDMSLEEGLRLHIPRAIRLVYGVRNKRDTGHLKSGIDPSLQDATLVVGTLDWILAELVRVAHGVTSDEAQDLIAGIATKDVPLVSVYNDKPVLLADLKHVDHLLVVLYWASSGSVTRGQIRGWLPEKMTKNLSRVLSAAEKDHYVHLDGSDVFLTPKGRRYVEENGLLQPV